MKRITYFFIICFFIVINGKRLWSQIQGELQTVSISTEELDNNLFADIETHQISVYLPPSYNSHQGRYPAVYFFPGYGCSYFNVNQFINSYDQAIINNDFKEMIVVIIKGCNDVLTGSFYVNSSVRGNWENFVIDEVIPYIDEQYRTISSIKSRGIAGHSMGGFGALNLAMLHPDVFCAVYGHSPGLFDESGLSDCQMFHTQSIINEYLTLENELSVLSKEESKAEFLSSVGSLSDDLIFTIAYGTSFSPDSTKNAPFLKYPYSKTGDNLILNETIWKTWESGFGGIKNEITSYKNNLLQLDSIVIEYGTNDFFTWIPNGCQYFSSQLESEQIPHTLLSYTGGHSDYSRYNATMFPMMENTLQFDSLTNSSEVNTYGDTFEVFPNPSNQSIFVFVNDQTASSLPYEIFDVYGQKVKQGMLQNNSIRLTDLAHGVYILILHANGKVLRSNKIVLE